MNFARTFAFLFAFLLFLPVHGLQAQSAGARGEQAISLQEAFELAQKQHPKLQAKRFEVKSARAGVREARQAYLPALDLHTQANYGTFNNIPGLFFPQPIVLPISGPVTGLNSSQGAYGSAAGALLSWSPTAFGQRSAQTQEAKSQLDYSSAAAEQALFAHQVEVANSFLNLLAAQELVTVQEKNLERAQAIATSVKAYTASGLRPGVDSSQANAEISGARLSLIQARQNQKVYRLRFQELLGTPEGPGYVAAKAFQQIPGGTSATQPPSLEAHPLLGLYRSRVQLGEARQRAISRSYRPSLKLQAAVFGRGSGVGINGSDWATGTEGLRLSRYNYAGGFTLTFPLLDFPQMRSRLAQETYRTAAEKAYLDEQTGLLTRDLAVAEARLAESQARVAETPVQLEAARAAFTQMSARYESGLANLAELAQVQYALNRAEVDHTLAVNEVWNAWLHKAAGLGDLEVFLNLVK